MKLHPLVTRLVCAGLMTSMLAGCAGSLNTKPDVQVQELRRGPGTTPQRNVTDFSTALQCMDQTCMPTERATS